MPLRLGTRGSRLALAQTHHVAGVLRDAHPGLEVEVVVIQTTGDRILDSPLSKIGGKGVFTKEIEEALLDGRIDVAVHSLKDVPVKQPGGLALAAVSAREDPQDLLVTRMPGTLRELPPGARVGTSSLRRRAQILHLHPAVQIEDLRGNVPTRLAKLESGQYDAIVLASAGVNRLGLGSAACRAIPFDEMLPAPGQGALGLQSREDDGETRSLLAAMHDADAAACCTAERAVLQGLGGGCQLPLGTLAEISNGRLTLRARVASLDGRDMAEGSTGGRPEDAEKLGSELARELLRQGADRILKSLVLNTDEGFDRAVAMARSLDKLPLGGRRVVVTRDEDADGPLSLALRAQGAQPLCLPLISHAPAQDDGPLRRAIGQAGEYHWMILTSRRGTEAVLRVLAETGLTLASLPCPIACVGEGTAQSVKEAGGRAALVAEDGTAESLAAALIESGVSGKRLLYPRSEIAGPALRNALVGAGAAVDDPVAYRTVRLAGADVLRAALRQAPPDAVLFCSASTVEAINGEDVLDLIGDAAIGSIGPRTSEALRRAGLEPTFEPSGERTYEGLVAALVEHFGTTRSN